MTSDLRRLFGELGLAVIERGWLSSNTVVFPAAPGSSAAVVDTGYVTHAALGIAAIESALGGQSLERVFNTHLHSDHCGGNDALQRRWLVETWVPEASVDLVAAWDTSRLSYEWTGQRCPRFSADGGLAAGQFVHLGSTPWEVLGAPGHDPDSIMLWQPLARVLISADALWEDRVSIIFPELTGEPGFDAATGVLDTIGTLNPSVVIPGHGAPFTGVGAALAASHARLSAFRDDPARHFSYSARALTMFHMLEFQSVDWDTLIAWLVSTPVFVHSHAGAGRPQGSLESWAVSTVSKLVSNRVLIRSGPMIKVADGRA